MVEWGHVDGKLYRFDPKYFKFPKCAKCHKRLDCAIDAEDPVLLCMGCYNKL